MLRQITVKNFVLIDEICLDFKCGMSAFTGETGAGKSLLIDAIGLLCGDKGLSGFVRKGSDSAIIEGVFEFNPLSNTYQTCLQYGFDPNDLMVFSRELTIDGKNMVRINGRMAPLSTLKEILSSCIDIHSQHDAQYLLNDRFHESLLDEYMGNQPIKDQVKECYRQWSKLHKEVNDKKQTTFNVNDLDFLNFQIQEIENFKPSFEDFQQLELSQKQMMAFEKISKKSAQAYEELEESKGVKEKLFEAFKLLESCDEDQNLQQWGEQLESLYYQIDEISMNLSSFLHNLEFDEDVLNEVQTRLYEYGKLMRKYGSSIEEIIQKKDEFIERVYMIENRQELLEQLILQEKEAFEKYQFASKQLTSLRVQFAQSLRQEIVDHLVDLQLPYAQFEVDFSSKEPSATGIDKIQFLISMNPGESLKPLSKVASGGELSRLMLGLKVIFSQLQGITTIIFDEIDSGVSGQIATKIGYKMRQLGETAQVLAVTHLAQVAAMAANHYLVLKTQTDETTTTTIVPLDNQQRIEQLALISSGTLSDKAILAASELLSTAQNTK